MFERLLALRYIKAQKRHSIFTICSIAVALALMTLLFVGYGTYRGIKREAAYANKPYHVKFLRLTEEEYEQLAANTEFLSCKRVVEPDYTISAEIMLGTYHDDLGLYINTLFPEKYIYSDLKETYKEDLIDVNYDLVEYDRLDFPSKYYAVYYLALFLIFIIFLVLALRVMIDTAFEISSKERERQYGMLQCMGAEPGQIVRILTFEGLFLSIVGIPLGVLLGLGLSVAAFEAIQASGIAEAFFAADQIPQIMKLHVSPLLLLLGAVIGLAWVMFSAYGTGMRIIKMSPIQAISGREKSVKKVRRFSLLGLIFGWKGKMAARNNRRQPKRFLITVASLTLSIMLVASFSIVLKRSLASFEKTVDMLGLNYDFELNMNVKQDDPLGYREALDVIRESGYFDIHSYSKSQIAHIPYDEENALLCLILYFPRETFEKQFQGELPVSYDELTEQNAYLMVEPADPTEQSVSSLFKEETELDVQVQARTIVSDEEYAAMTDEEKEEVKESTFTDYTTGEHVLLYRYRSEHLPASLKLAGSVREQEMDEDTKKFLGVTNTYATMLVLAGTLDTYENGAYQLAGEYGSVINSEGFDSICVNLKDKADYEKAKTYVSMNSALLSIAADNYGDLQKARTVVGTVKIIVGFMSILIGLIAIVNMVNILSTGILNRKAELAAMQCIGMTQGQLNGMTVIECLQYALTAGVLATLLIEGLIYLMYLFLKKIDLAEVFDEMLNYTEPLPLIWIAAAVTFFAAVIASFVPLYRMQKESLTEQIRCVE